MYSPNDDDVEFLGKKRKRDNDDISYDKFKPSFFKLKKRGFNNNNFDNNTSNNNSLKKTSNNLNNINNNNNLNKTNNNTSNNLNKTNNNTSNNLNKTNNNNNNNNTSNNNSLKKANNNFNNNNNNNINKTNINNNNFNKNGNSLSVIETIDNSKYSHISTPQVSKNSSMKFTVDNNKKIKKEIFNYKIKEPIYDSYYKKNNIFINQNINDIDIFHKLLIEKIMNPVDEHIKDIFSKRISTSVSDTIYDNYKNKNETKLSINSIVTTINFKRKFLHVNEDEDNNNNTIDSLDIRIETSDNSLSFTITNSETEEVKFIFSSNKMHNNNNDNNNNSLYHIFLVSYFSNKIINNNTILFDINNNIFSLLKSNTYFSKFNKDSDIIKDFPLSMEIGTTKKELPSLIDILFGAGITSYSSYSIYNGLIDDNFNKYKLQLGLFYSIISFLLSKESSSNI